MEIIGINLDKKVKADIVSKYEDIYKIIENAIIIDLVDSILMSIEDSVTSKEIVLQPV